MSFGINFVRELYNMTLISVKSILTQNRFQLKEKTFSLVVWGIVRSLDQNFARQDVDQKTAKIGFIVNCLFFFNHLYNFFKSHVYIEVFIIEKKEELLKTNQFRCTNQQSKTIWYRVISKLNQIILNTLRELIFATTNFCGSQFWDF